LREWVLFATRSQMEEPTPQRQRRLHKANHGEKEEKLASAGTFRSSDMK
jgi:hypothetical protein